MKKTLSPQSAPRAQTPKANLIKLGVLSGLCGALSLHSFGTERSKPR
jgi:hypothetical protein